MSGLSHRVSAAAPSLGGRGADAATGAGAGVHWLDRVAEAPFRFVARLPFSLAMIVAVVVLAWWTGTIHGGLDHATRERYGYDLENLRHGRLWVLVTSEVLTGYPAHVRNTIEMLVVWLVPYEWLAGTGRALVVYWAGTLIATGTSALISLVLVHGAAWDRSPDLITASDVGASVGAWAVAGALSVELAGRGPVARLIGLALPVYGVIYLGGALFTRWGISDFAHPIGLAVGIVTAGLLGRRPRREPRPVWGRRPAAPVRAGGAR